MMRYRVLTIVLLAVFGTAATALAKGNATAGKDLFAKNCKMCHGTSGEGNPGMAKALDVEFRPLASKEVQARSDEELAKIITEGNGKMKPVKNVSGGAVDDVVTFVRTLAAK